MIDVPGEPPADWSGWNSSDRHTPAPPLLWRPSGTRQGLAAHLRNVIVTDCCVVVLMVFAGNFVRIDGGIASGRVPLSWPALVLVTLGIAMLWLGALAINHVWEAAALADRSSEMRRLGAGTLVVFVIVGMVAFATGWEVPRGYLTVSFPVGWVLLAGAHSFWAARLAGRRRAGELLTEVLVVGDRRSAATLTRIMRARPEAGYRVRGICLAAKGGGARNGVDGGDLRAEIECGVAVGGDGAVDRACSAGGEPRGNPVLFDTAVTPAEVAAMATAARVGAIAVTEGTIGTDWIAELAWRLDGTTIEMLLVPEVADAVGPRSQVRPLSDVVLLRAEEPRLLGPALIVKTVFDVVIALATLVVLLPLLLVVTVTIAIAFGPPVFLEQERVGVSGRIFRVWSFRTSPVDRTRRPPVSGTAYHAPETRIARFVRRIGAGDLPYLINVLAGQMSLVGPMPRDPRDRPSTGPAGRDPSARPGLTGPWRLMGQPDGVEGQALAERHYIESWSFGGDLALLARTFTRIIRGRDTAAAPSTAQDSRSRV